MDCAWRHDDGRGASPVSLVDAEVVMPLLNPALAQLARRRHGILTAATVLAAGGTSHQVRRAVERGELERVHPGVFRIGGAPRTWHQSVLLAVLAGGPDALASHRSAAALWELDGSTHGRPEIVAPRHLRSRFEAARCHESTDLHLARPTERRGIPCTGIERTLVDLGAVVPLERVQQAIDDAIRRRLCDWDDLFHALVMHSRRGRRGVGPLRAVLEECYGQAVPDSRFNRLVERLLVESGLPSPTIEYEIRGPGGAFVARVDLAYPHLKIAIELDGRRHHLTAAAFEADRPRQNRLELLGWTVLRYTWRHYVDSPWVITGDVRAAIDAAAA